MEKFTKDISEIITNEINKINYKVRGLNFLELIKINIIEKISHLINNQKLPLEQYDYYQSEIKDEYRQINFSVSFFPKSAFINKKKLDNDSLFLCFNETSNFDIYKDEKILTSIPLYKNTGISLPKETVINLKYNKSVLFVEITNIEIDQILK
jgi:hypothetical protein